MITINHSYYPHVVDLILDHAPPASLLAMAKTCRNWTRCSLNRFYHVKNPRVIKAHIVRHVSIDNPLLGRISLSKGELVLLKGCKVLDITSRERRWRPWYLPNLETVRYHEGLAELPRTHARQAVFQNHLPPFSRFLYKIKQTKQIVIYISKECGRLYWHKRALAHFPSAEQLVFIFDDDNDNSKLAPSEGTSSPANRLDMDYDFLETVKHVVVAAVQKKIRVMLVGTERWNVETFNVLKLGVERVYKHSDDNLDFYRPISLSTLGVYREFVGEEQWAVMTDWKGTLSPKRLKHLKK